MFTTHWYSVCTTSKVEKDEVKDLYLMHTCLVLIMCSGSQNSYITQARYRRHKGVSLWASQMLQLYFV